MAYNIFKLGKLPAQLTDEGSLQNLPMSWDLVKNPLNLFLDLPLDNVRQDLLEAKDNS